MTVREREVFGLLSDGLTNHQIAAELGVADSTAKTHVAHILDKLGFASRYELLEAARPPRGACPVGCTLGEPCVPGGAVGYCGIVSITLEIPLAQGQPLPFSNTP